VELDRVCTAAPGVRDAQLARINIANVSHQASVVVDEFSASPQLWIGDTPLATATNRQ
jgi:hypothetical protein